MLGHLVGYTRAPWKSLDGKTISQTKNASFGKWFFGHFENHVGLCGAKVGHVGPMLGS